jgi:replicative DNA helicase
LEHGSADPRDRVTVQTGKRINLLNGKAVEQVHRWIDEYEPDLLMVGPIYKMVPGSLNDEDVTARLLGALDEFRERGVTLLIEGHAGHGKDDKGDREFRPRGSSMMLGWPEFGLGLKSLSETEAELVKWRGSREERPWPRFIRHGGSGELPWVPSNGSPDGMP